MIDFGHATDTGVARTATWAPGEGRARAMALREEVMTITRYMTRGLDGLRTDMDRPALSSGALDAIETRVFGQRITSGSCPRRTAAWRAVLGLPRR